MKPAKVLLQVGKRPNEGGGREGRGRVESDDQGEREKEPERNGVSVLGRKKKRNQGTIAIEGGGGHRPGLTSKGANNVSKALGRGIAG